MKYLTNYSILTHSYGGAAENYYSGPMRNVELYFDSEKDYKQISKIGANIYKTPFHSILAALPFNEKLKELLWRLPYINVSAIYHNPHLKYKDLHSVAYELSKIPEEQIFSWPTRDITDLIASKLK